MKKLSGIVLALLAGMVPALAMEEYPVHISTEEWGRIHAEAFENTRKNDPGFFKEMMEEVQATRTAGDIGETRVFTTNDSTKLQSYKVYATLRAKGPGVNLWVENEQWAPGKITQADADRMLENLLRKTGPYSFDPNKGIVTLNREAFGETPNKAGDGILHVLVMDVRDFWTPEKGGPYTGGYFSPVDQIAGNKCDLIYIDSYPTIYQDAKGLRDMDKACSTIAHELQHLIHYKYHRSKSALWLNEAMSQAAVVHSGYKVSSNVNNYLNTPNMPLTIWHKMPMDPMVMHDYQRVQLWATYVRDQFGTGVWKKFVQGPPSGIKGVDSALSSAGSSFDKAYTDFILALCANNRAINPKFGFNYRHMENIQANADSVHWTYPVSIANKSVERHGLLMYRFTAGKNLSLTFTGTNCFAKLMKISDDAIDVVDLASGVPMQDPGFGSSYGEALVVVGSLMADKEKSEFSITANADAKGIFELAHDKGVSDIYVSKPKERYYAGVGAKKTGWGWAVQFDCPPEANLLTKVTPALYGSATGTHESSTVMLHVYSDNGGVPGDDLVAPVKVALKGFWKELDIAKLFGSPIAVPSRFYIGFTHENEDSTPMFLLHKETGPVNRTWRINPGAAPQPLCDLKDAAGAPYGQRNIMVHATVVSSGR